MHLQPLNLFSCGNKFATAWNKSTLYTYMPVEVSELAGDDLNAGHDMLEELHVDLLWEGGLLVRGRPRDVQQVHQRLDRTALTTWHESVSKDDFLKPQQVYKCLTNVQRRKNFRNKKSAGCAWFLKKFVQEEWTRMYISVYSCNWFYLQILP